MAVAHSRNPLARLRRRMAIDSPRTCGQCLLNPTRLAPRLPRAPRADPLLRRSRLGPKRLITRRIQPSRRPRRRRRAPRRRRQLLLLQPMALRMARQRLALSRIRAKGRLHSSSVLHPALARHRPGHRHRVARAAKHKASRSKGLALEEGIPEEQVEVSWEAAALT